MPKAPAGQVTSGGPLPLPQKKAVFSRRPFPPTQLQDQLPSRRTRAFLQRGHLAYQKENNPKRPRAPFILANVLKPLPQRAYFLIAPFVPAIGASFASTNQIHQHRPDYFCSIPLPRKKALVSRSNAPSPQTAVFSRRPFSPTQLPAQHNYPTSLAFAPPTRPFGLLNLKPT